MVSPFGKNRDMFYMDEALSSARIAMQKDEVPIGAVVVNNDGEIIARAYNTTEHDCTQGSHAEMKAVADAGKKVGDWRLNGCWIYVTLEPCAMCMYALLLSRVDGIVYGAPSNVYGFHLDNALLLQVYKKDTLRVVKGVREAEAQELLKQFFKQKRKDTHV